MLPGVTSDQGVFLPGVTFQCVKKGHALRCHSLNNSRVQRCFPSCFGDSDVVRRHLVWRSRASTSSRNRSFLRRHAVNLRPAIRWPRKERGHCFPLLAAERNHAVIDDIRRLLFNLPCELYHYRHRVLGDDSPQDVASIHLVAVRVHSASQTSISLHCVSSVFATVHTP